MDLRPAMMTGEGTHPGSASGAGNGNTVPGAGVWRREQEYVQQKGKKDMKVGVIGVGGMGSTHNSALKALSESMDVEVTAIADVRNEFLDKGLRLWPGARGYALGMDLISQEELDCVHICLPSYLHADHAIAAMERGMDVLVEKPACLTLEDCRRMEEARKRSGVRVMVGQVVRFFPEFQYLKECCDSGRYGKLKSIAMRRLSGKVTWGYEDWFLDEEKSGSVIMDLHIHDLDFLRYLLGEPDAIQVFHTEYESGMPNQAAAVLEYPGVFAVAEGLWDVSEALPFQTEYRAYFQDASIVYDSGTGVRVYKKDGTTEIPEIIREEHLKRDSSNINISTLGPYYTEIKYFYECLLHGREPERAALGEGLKSVELGIREWDQTKKIRWERENGRRQGV